METRPPEPTQITLCPDRRKYSLQIAEAIVKTRGLWETYRLATAEGSERQAALILELCKAREEQAMAEQQLRDHVGQHQCDA